MSPGVSLGEIVRRIGPQYEQSHRLTRPQRRALRAISLCRTPALGGHLDQCAHCGFRHKVWHSCRNRHCPSCQAEARKRWLVRSKNLTRAREQLGVVAPHDAEPDQDCATPRCPSCLLGSMITIEWFDPQPVQGIAT